MVNCQLFSIVTKVGGSRVRVRTRMYDAVNKITHTGAVTTPRRRTSR